MNIEVNDLRGYVTVTYRRNGGGFTNIYELQLEINQRKRSHAIRDVSEDVQPYEILGLIRHRIINVYVRPINF